MRVARLAVDVDLGGAPGDDGCSDVQPSGFVTRPRRAGLARHATADWSPASRWRPSASIIVLDVRGYSFTARRLAVGGSQTAWSIALAVAAYRAIGRAISRNAWRWARPSRSWAMALTSAVAFRASARSRGTVRPGSVAEPSIRPADSSDPADDSVPLEDLAAGLRRSERLRHDRPDAARDRVDLGSRPGPRPLPAQPAALVRRRPDPGHPGQRDGSGRRHPAGCAGLAIHEHPLRRDDLPPDARRPRRTVRRRHALPLRRPGPDDARCARGRPPRPGQDRRRPGGPGRRLGVRPPGDRLQLRLRHHPASGTADPHRRRRHRRGHHREGRPDQHPRHDDRQLATTRA